MSAHTPGPWHYTSSRVNHYVTNKGGATVAMVKGSVILAYDLRRKADAVLCAAAPELYEALDLCLNLLWKDWTPDYCTADLDYESLPEIQKARAALAKARGES